MKSFRFYIVVYALSQQLLWADSNLCTVNNSPFHQYHYTPCTSLASSGDYFDIQLISERSNIFYYDESGILDRESAVVDGEVSRQILMVERKIDRFIWGGELSQVAFSAGRWDSAIEGWHNTFNFVNWDRENYPQNDLNYQYHSEDIQMSISEAQKLQRLSVHIGLAFQEGNDWLNSIRLGRTLSTDNELVAPETTWVGLQTPVIVLSAAHSVSANFGVSYSDKHGGFSSIQKPWLFFGGVNYKYKWYKNFKVLSGLSGNTAHYESESVILGKPSSQISAALAWDYNRGNSFSLALVEDLQIGASPDVTLQLAYRYKSH